VNVTCGVIVIVAVGDGVTVNVEVATNGIATQKAGSDNQPMISRETTTYIIDKKTLVIKEIPFSTTTTSLMESIVKASEKGQIKVKQVIDNTARDVEIQILLQPGQSPEIAIDALFAKHNDHWVHPPSAWANPDDALEQTEFWQVFQDCLAGLPARQAQAFTLTEVDGLSTEELCKALAAQPSNVWVMLHRARMALRECLEMNWFDKMNPPKGH
jgi:RNA polymerase sigma factor (sigma-70 family)